jgi:hypothetical protein
MKSLWTSPLICLFFFHTVYYLSFAQIDDSQTIIGCVVRDIDGRRTSDQQKRQGFIEWIRIASPQNKLVTTLTSHTPT